MGGGLDKSDCYASVFQVFRHFHTDKTAADNHRAVYALLIHKGLDGIRVRDVPQAEYLFTVNAGNVRFDRFAARR